MIQRRINVILNIGFLITYMYARIFVNYTRIRLFTIVSTHRLKYIFIYNALKRAAIAQSRKETLSKPRGWPKIDRVR